MTCFEHLCSAQDFQLLHLFGEIVTNFLKVINCRHKGNKFNFTVKNIHTLPFKSLESVGLLDNLFFVLELFIEGKKIGRYIPKNNSLFSPCSGFNFVYHAIHKITGFRTINIS